MDVREKLVELLKEVVASQECSFGDPRPTYETVASCLIAHGVTVQEWISVEDRLPENDVMVIGFTPCDGFMFVGYYHEETKYDWKAWMIITAMRCTKVMKKKVTHWLPLPQPPKGE